MNSISVTDFLNTELRDYAKYSTIRGLASAIDGLKNSGRKVIYSAQSELNKETKVSVFAGITQLKTVYLHGDISEPIVKLARNYCGTNNLPLLKPCGNFGTRMLPEASATRYIFTEKQPYFNKIINPLDNEILISQEFEGETIEPRFFVPTIPLILVNGTDGIATGYSNEILPRSPENIRKYLLKYLQNGESDTSLLNIHFNNFKGTILQNENRVSIQGSYRIEKNTIHITEIPIGYNLISYKKQLDLLEEEKIIQSYEDLSDNDEFYFIIKVHKDFITKGEDYILRTLKLVKRFSENYTCIDADNNVIVFNSAEEIIQYYIKIKLEFLEKRLENIIHKKTSLFKELYSEYFFIKSVLDDEIDLKKCNKEDIITILESNEKIVQKNNSYDYLLRIPVLNLTPNKMEELKNRIKSLKEEIDVLKEKTPKDVWIEDLESLTF